MFEAAVDPKSGRIYYEDYAARLALDKFVVG